ncbi:hypothetical protein OKW41_003701 [Paraburkholderia sp. UCT70]
MPIEEIDYVIFRAPGLAAVRDVMPPLAHPASLWIEQ